MGRQYNVSNNIFYAEGTGHNSAAMQAPARR